MTTAWYYAYHKDGAFSQQKALCDAVRWNICNLEGQRLKPPNTLSAILGNPLTIRLLALDSAIEKFSNFKDIGKRIEEISRQEIDRKQYFSMVTSREAENSPLGTMGAPIEIIDTTGERFVSKHVDIQLALYDFFVNFGSIVDRLAYEIDRLFCLRIPQNILDWNTLVNQKKKYSNELNKKNHDLTDLLTKYVQKFESASKYRNRLVHDGIIACEVTNTFIKSGIMLAEDPNNDNSQMNVDAIKFCEDTRKELINLLEQSYTIMLKNIDRFGNPPW